MPSSSSFTVLDAIEVAKKAAELKERKMKYESIAKILNRNPKTVSKYYKMYLEGGIAAIKQHFIEREKNRASQETYDPTGNSKAAMWGPEFKGQSLFNQFMGINIK